MITICVSTHAIIITCAMKMFGRILHLYQMVFSIISPRRTLINAVLIVYISAILLCTRIFYRVWIRIKKSYTFEFDSIQIHFSHRGDSSLSSAKKIRKKKTLPARLKNAYLVIYVNNLYRVITGNLKTNKTRFSSFKNAIPESN